MFRPTRHALFGAISFVAIAALLTGCGQHEAPARPARPVLTAVVQLATTSVATQYTGEIRSRYETVLAFRIGGKIAARLVDAGAVVKAGDVLARLDASDTALTMVSAQAQLDLAKAEVQRYRELRRKNFVSQAALDAKETAYTAAQAQADLAANQSAYTVLRAERAGVISQVNVEVGQVVTPGQAVMRLSRVDTPEVAVAIPESRIRQVRAHKRAEVTLWSEEKARYAAELRELSPVADAATRTYAARVAIKQPDERILLGMTANVIFTDSSDDNRTEANDEAARVTIPLTAVFQKNGKPAVWVVGADQQLTLRPVEVVAFNEAAAILRGGVQPGERIVVAGVHKLAAGEKIKAVDRATPAGSRQ